MRYADRIAETDIAISCVIPPPPLMDLSTAPPAIQKLAATTGLTPGRARELPRRHDRPTACARRTRRGWHRRRTQSLAGSREYSHRDGAALDEAGLSTAATLVAATFAAARVCGLGHRKGLLQDGFDADLIVVDGDLHK